MGRLIVVMMLLLGMGACTNPNDLDEAPAYLGNFHLGHNVVVAPNLTRGPASREATDKEWIEAMEKAIDDRFRRYQGTKLYHLGVTMEGYVLAVSGIPLIAAPKSVLVIRVSVWDDAAQKKLNEEAELFTVVETISGETMISSGLTQSKEVQMENLTKNASKMIQNWLVKQNDEQGWFEDDGKPARDKPASAKRVRQAQPEDQPAEAEAESPEQDQAASEGEEGPVAAADAEEDDG